MTARMMKEKAPLEAEAAGSEEPPFATMYRVGC